MRKFLEKSRAWLNQWYLVFGVIFFFTVCFPQVVLHPTTVFGYGGGGGGVNTVNNNSADPVFSSVKKITNFEFKAQFGSTIFDEENALIRVTMPYGTDLRTLAPIISFEGEKVSPQNGEILDFTRARTYTVTAENNTTKEYTVMVDLAPKEEVQEPLSVWFTETVAKTDLVRDGVIDILDFNTLMVHWSDPSSRNPADLNKDKTVDVFDFNMVMIYWGQMES